MNGYSHANIMIGAVDALPVAYRELLEPMRGLLADVANYPDYFDDPTRPVADKERIDPEWRRFCVFPESMAGPFLHAWPYSNDEQAKRRPITTYWMELAIAAWHEGDRASFIKFMGCLSHMLGDITQSAHLMDLRLLAELLPHPESMPNFHYHTDIEAVTGVCGALRPPMLLGLSVEEAAWRLSADNTTAVRHCRRHIVPIAQALFAGNYAEAERVAGEPVTWAAQSTLDLLYSTLKLACGDITDDDAQSLATIDLRLWKPDTEQHDLVYSSAILDGNRNTPPSGAPIIPGLLRDAQGNVHHVPGIGMLPHSGMNGPRTSWMRYELPMGVFSRFTTQVGMHAELTQDGATEFIIELDDREVFRSGRRTAVDPALPVSIDLENATALTMMVADANDARTFWHNHAYWGEPQLLK